MGLFDGTLGAGEMCSTAQVAKWLNSPVLLVLDAASQGRSIAALGQGFARFDSTLPFLGIVCNNVSSSRHQQILAESLVEHVPELPVFGFMPKLPQLSLPSRHLGLALAEQRFVQNEFIPTLQKWAEDNLCIDAMLQTLVQRQKAEGNIGVAGANTATYEVCTPESAPNALQVAVETVDTPVRIAVALDAAFWGDYEDNLEAITNAGASLVPFSPLADAELPANCAGVLMGGGYPELYAAQLAGNTSMLASVRSHIAKGVPVFAHGGGFMYLMRSLEDMDGQQYDMANIFPFSCVMRSRFQSLGYRTITFAKAALASLEGNQLRGHQFHYSTIVQNVSDMVASKAVTCAAHVVDMQGVSTSLGLYSPMQYPHVIGGYVHPYFASCPGFAKAFVTACATNMLR